MDAVNLHYFDVKVTVDFHINVDILAVVVNTSFGDFPILTFYLSTERIFVYGCVCEFLLLLLFFGGVRIATLAKYTK